MKDLWGAGPAGAADELDPVVHLCRAVGADPDLVQPGGGNASVKMKLRDRFGVEEDTLLVKGSGLDLRSIDRGGFTALSASRLSPLRERDEMDDTELVDLMRAAMRNPHRDPFPSVETPLHAILPHPVVLHTHDVATLSLTDLAGETGRDLVKRLFPGEVLFLPYCRPGFTLARAVRERAGRIPTAAVGMILARHGLVVWGENARQCHDRLVRIVGRVEEYLEEKRSRGRKPPAAAALPGAAEREERAAVLLPVIRGFLGGAGRVVLHRDGSDEILGRLSSAGARERSGRGVATPDHILVAGRRPLWIECDFEAPPAKWAESARRQLEDSRREYLEYHGRNARGGEESIRDWAKVVLVPGVGMITAGRDRTAALAAAGCYRAVLKIMDNADPLGGFEFLDESEVFHFEHWPLERRKLEERDRDAGSRRLLPGGVAVVIGGGSGIGAAAAERFAEEGAHVLVADIDARAAGEVADRIAERFPGRAAAAGVDVREETSVAAAVRRAVLEFGGIDSLFYTAGLAPGFLRIADASVEEARGQIDVHFLGALISIREAARAMRLQGTGGSIVCSVSKAALAPGPGAAAYGASKAALLHALRTAAIELGADGIRVNAINADQVDTPLFIRFAQARARAAGRTLEQQLEEYRRRNALGVSLIPPRAVAEIAVLLASERFAYTTGDILTVDGGLPDAFPR